MHRKSWRNEAYRPAAGTSTNLYMKMSQSPARRFPQREQASMAWRQVSLSPPSSGSMPKKEEEEDAIIFQRWS